ncbi:hypothetical protein L0Y87_19245 [Burkholderia multivorans]|uniref:hypothetical protein n=1 Tax=Burkholderia multivorans TaxID=87883 RepID=UPI00207D3EB3|nr:hypothetical protein [Burkholderia multivorans]MCO1384341.1 hypothetical protein [Burkholderia multivorans]
MKRSIAIALTFAPGLANARGATHSGVGSIVVLILALWIACKLTGPMVVRALRPVVAWVRDFLIACRKLFTRL